MGAEHESRSRSGRGAKLFRIDFCPRVCTHTQFCSNLHNVLISFFLSKPFVVKSFCLHTIIFCTQLKTINRTYTHR